MRMGNTVIMRNAGFQFRRTVNDGSGRDLSVISNVVAFLREHLVGGGEAR